MQGGGQQCCCNMGHVLLDITGARFEHVSEQDLVARTSKQVKQASQYIQVFKSRPTLSSHCQAKKEGEREEKDCR